MKSASRIVARASGPGRRAARLAATRRDHEDRAALDAALEAADDAARSRPSLLSLLSHDLRNPLAALPTCVSVIRRALPAEHAAHRQVEVIQRSADELTQMLDTTSDVARIDLGRLLGGSDPAPPGALIAAAAASVQRFAQGKRLDVQVGADVPEIRADRPRLVRTLASLLTRALRITPKPGPVTVRAERDGDGARITITDGGATLSEERRASIFDVPLDEAEHRTSGQHFLFDLYVARGVIEAHGGAIEIVPTGSGTALVLTLPGHDALRPPS